MWIVEVFFLFHAGWGRENVAVGFVGGRIRDIGNI